MLGVPYDTEVEVRVANDFGAGALYSDTIDAQTGPLPEELPLPALLSSDPDQLDAADAVLFTSIQTPTGAAWRLMVDRLGRVVWAQQNTLAQGTTSWVDSARSGSELLWEDANWFAPEGVEPRAFVQRLSAAIPFERLQNFTCLRIPDTKAVI